MEEYLNLLMEQVRCKKAHPYIREELQGHMEEQIRENMEAGMPKEEAERAAVEDMGSPVEVGISLDRIHRPKAAWGMLGLMALISLAAIFLHQMILGRAGEAAAGSADFAMHTIIGFILMLVVYHLDYSVIARYAGVSASIFIGVGVFALSSGRVANGMIAYAYIGSLRVSVFAIMMLYVPLYGALIYRHYGLGYKALRKAVLWMAAPVIIAYRLPNLPLAIILLIAMSVVLTVAVGLGWFQVSKKKVITALWGCVLGVPTVYLAVVLGFGLLRTHQVERMHAFLTASGSENYVTNMLRDILAASRFIGSSETELTGYLRNYSNDYIFSYVLSNYGLLWGIILCCILAVVLIKIFTVCFKQKSQLGMCMGCGCGMIILLNVIMHIGINLGLLPVTGSFLPFFSTGGSSIITSYVLMGIILSVYRYKNIYPARVKLVKKINI